MDRVQTYGALQQILGAELNAIQNNAAGGDGTDTAQSSTIAHGVRFVLAYDGAGGAIVNATIQTLDTRDWRDRVLVVFCTTAVLAVNQVPGGVNDYLLDHALSMQLGYTGRGALDFGGSNPTDGNPPVPVSGFSWATSLSPGWLLYADPSTGALKIYNNTGGALYLPFLRIDAHGPTGARP